eukprot:s3773_g6.t1
MHETVVQELEASWDESDDGRGVGFVPDPRLPPSGCGKASRSACNGRRADERDRDDSRAFFELNIFGWNVGGAPLDCLGEALTVHAGRRVDGADDIFLIQEFSRRQLGWSVATRGRLREVSHRYRDQWRGDGLAFDPVAWTVVSRRAAGKGVWFRVKHLATAFELWLGTIHLTPGCNQCQFSSEVQGFLGKKPKDGLPVLVQGDANTHIEWAEGEAQGPALGHDGKSTILLNALAEHKLVPTSRPRQADRQGRHIDLFATQRVLTSDIRIYKDSCYIPGTDHELLHGQFRLRAGKGVRRCCTGPRVWTGGVKHVDHIDQSTLERLAAEHTKPRPSQAYQDPQAVKQLFRRAKVSNTREAWKRALRGRGEARRVWESERLRRALDGDWTAYRESSRQCSAGWEIGFAEAQGLDAIPPLEGSFSVFSVEELQVALGQLKRGKSAGKDLTSTELLEIEGGRQHLLEFLNRTFVSQVVPPAWNQPLVILLPKVAKPTCAKDVRPIALGSSTSKLFARMVTNRIAGQLEHRSPAQCAGRHRQPSDVIFTLCRLFQLEHEWKRGLVALKLDVSKAFDSVNRAQLLSRLRQRLGDTLEFRALRALLLNTEATLQSAWGTSSFEMGSGIKQGMWLWQTQ